MFQHVKQKTLHSNYPIFFLMIIFVELFLNEIFINSDFKCANCDQVLISINTNLCKVINMNINIMKNQIPNTNSDETQVWKNLESIWKNIRNEVNRNKSILDDIINDEHKVFIKKTH